MQLPQNALVTQFLLQVSVSQVSETGAQRWSAWHSYNSTTAGAFPHQPSLCCSSSFEKEGTRGGMSKALMSPLYTQQIWEHFFCHRQSVQPPLVNSQVYVSAVCYVLLCELLPGMLASNTPLLYAGNGMSSHSSPTRALSHPLPGSLLLILAADSAVPPPKLLTSWAIPPLQIHEHIDPSCFTTPDFIRISLVEVRTAFEVYSIANFKAGWGKDLLEDIISSKKVRKPLSSNTLAMWLSSVIVQCDCPSSLAPGRQMGSGEDES